MAPGMELQLAGVVIIGCPHGSNECHVVDAIAQLRPPVANFNAALAVFPVPDLHGEDLSHQLSVGR